MPKINLVQAKNYDGEKLKKLHKALALVEQILNSAQFKDKVLNFVTDGKKTLYFRRSLFGKWIEKPYANEHVFNMIMTAQENPGNQYAGWLD